MAACSYWVQSCRERYENSGSGWADRPEWLVIQHDGCGDWPISTRELPVGYSVASHLGAAQFALFPNQEQAEEVAALLTLIGEGKS